MTESVTYEFADADTVPPPPPGTRKLRPSPTRDLLAELATKPLGTSLLFPWKHFRLLNVGGGSQENKRRYIVVMARRVTMFGPRWFKTRIDEDGVRIWKTEEPVQRRDA